MNPYLAAAAVLALAVGFIHSVIGEVLIFSRMRTSGLIPTNGGSILQERHVRIIWASWHVLTILGWLVATILFWLSRAAAPNAAHRFLELPIALAMFVSAALVLFGTKGRHPGWIGLLGVAVLICLGRQA